MKTYLQFFIFLLFAGISFGQASYSDNFESYNAGDGIASNSSEWIIWPAAGATDAAISDERAASGTKSLRLDGTTGAVDVILLYDGVHDSGFFSTSMNIFVPEGNGAYFNMQGLEGVGQGVGIWNFQVYMEADGTMRMENTDFDDIINTTYQQGEWLNFKFDVNLQSNSWSLFINDECIISWANSNVSVASMNFYPRPDIGDNFFVDDLSFEHFLETPFSVDAGIAPGISDLAGIAGTEKEVEVTLSNGGNEMITSYTVSFQSNGVSDTQSFSTSLAPGDSEIQVFDTKVNLIDGDNIVTVSLLDVNGSVDDDYTCNNSVFYNLNGIPAAQGKKVFIEEATGTWCQFCPRGDYFMNMLSEKYPERYVGVAVHNGDPMAAEVPAWDQGLTSLPGFTGFPNAYVNRATIVDPSGLEDPFIESVQNDPLVFLEHGATYDETTRELFVSVSTTFNFPLSGDIRLFVGLTEDSINRNEPGYAQVNAFAGDGPGVLGGYGELPNPVPASQMTYNHVARYMFTDFQGLQGAYADQTIALGDVVNLQFGPYIIPDDYNVDNMHIVSGFRAVNGAIDNAESTTIDEAVASGFVGTIDEAIDASISVFPNPFSDVVNIEMNFDEPTEISMEVTDAMGQLVAKRSYGTIVGGQIFTFNGTDLSNGVYYLKLYDGEKFTTKRVVISH